MAIAAALIVAAIWGVTRVEDRFMAVCCSVLAIGCFIGSFFTVWYYLPNDHVDVLTREGEIFEIKREDPYFMGEWVPWDTVSINTRTRNSFFNLPEQSGDQPVLKPPTVPSSDGIPLRIYARVAWRPDTSTDSKVENLYQGYIRHRKQSKVGYAIWHSYTGPKTRDAMEDCGNQIRSYETPESVSDSEHPYMECLFRKLEISAPLAIVEDIEIIEIDRDPETILSRNSLI